MFNLDPAIKRECIWHGPRYRRSTVLVDRRNTVVSLPGNRDEEGAILTKDLSPADSMLATIADPQRAPEMLAVRESIRGWRFYDGFRTDMNSPVRIPQIGTFTPVLNNEGTDLPAALQTILEIGDSEALTRTVDDAFSIPTTIQNHKHKGVVSYKLQMAHWLDGAACSQIIGKEGQ
jgi:predicted ATPase